MSEFEEYIKNKYPEDYAVLSTMYSNQAMEELYPDKFEVWQHQQAKIEKLENELSTTKQVLGNVIDMEVAKADNLKTQLNNMEACYIGKKKERDDLQNSLDELIKHDTRIERKWKAAEKTADKYKSKVSMITNLLRDCSDQDMTLKAIQTVIDRVGEHE